jgi:Tfp pilus assembly protein PilO
LQKAEQHWDSACSSLNQAETQLEDVRNTWEFKTEQALETLQALQEQRLNAMSNFQIVLVATVKDELTYGLKVCPLNES